MELLAMHDARRPRDAEFIGAQWRVAMARARSFEENDDVLSAWREYSSMARDFAGLAEAAPATQRAKQIEQSAAYRDARRRQQQAVREQNRLAHDFQAAYAELPRNLGEGNFTFDVAQAAAKRLANQRKREKDPQAALVLERALNHSFLVALEGGREQLHEKKAVLAEMSFLLAAELRPDSPAPHMQLARAFAARGKKADVLRELRRAFELGAGPAALARLLENSPEMERLRNDPEIRALLESPQPKPDH
jgi:hypothetical protein